MEKQILNRARWLLIAFFALFSTTFVWADIVVTLNNIGASLSTTANTTIQTTEVTASGSSDSYDLNYYQCKKQSNAIFMTKSASPFIGNKTEMPGNIKSIAVTTNDGSSGNTTYDVAFGTSAFGAATAGIGAYKIGANASHTYTNSSVGGARFFCITLGNAYNGQVLNLVITCEESSSAEPGGSLTPKNRRIMAGGNERTKPNDFS